MSGADFRRGSKHYLLWLMALAWLLLVLASMRPQWLSEVVEVPVTGRDIMLAVDLSESMLEKDFVVEGQHVDRLSALKKVAGEFISRRKGDRIGLILFGEQAYLQAPLTFDRKTVRILLNEAAIGLAGTRTAIGDAIALAVKRLRERDESHRVLVLLTDGKNTAGGIEPLIAADLAAREGLKIYTVGIGADTMLVKNLFFTLRHNPSAGLDEKTLLAIAEKSKGRYFRAKDTEEFAEIYNILDKLEPIEADPLKLRPRKALFYWPLSFALALSGFIIVLSLWR